MDNFIWLSGVSNDYVREAARGELYGRVGVLLGPATFGGPGAKANYCPHIEDYSAWALDNGCFTNQGAFDEAAWLDRLSYIYNEVPGANDSCLFAVAPDVYDPVAGRGDPTETILRSIRVLPKIREIGVPAALVFQDGLENFDLEAIPWDAFDVAFIGGGDHFKLGQPHNWKAGNHDIVYDRESEPTLAFMRLIARAHEEGKPVHVGRVNTKVRLRYSRLIGAESSDGTLIARAGRQGLKRIENWMPLMTAA